ncbi:hypothetical protein FCH33_20285 [Serratia fonticola]|uniref:hypothetical protein n=1 Tax=Serratia fonticola TaxID=47917 RepID=UPI001576926C|nr:hypothetical protein [Serratia fonticola]NTY89113.1 hypothetical protein [Serratia fonticola]NTZ14675.1 hypothetical protein [Serratia fonticola]
MTNKNKPQRRRRINTPAGTESMPVTATEASPTLESDESRVSELTKVEGRHIDWRKEFSDGLEWLHNRAWPLGGVVFFLSVICLFNYVTQAHVSLSITSSSVIAALPTMMALVIFIGFILVATMVMPTAVLFAPIEKNGPQLVSLLTTQIEHGNNKIEWRFIFIWMMMLLVMNFITLIIVSFFLEAFSRNTVWASPLFIFSSIISCLLVLLGATRLVNKKIPLRNISAEYWGASCSTAILQIFMVTTSMLFAMRLAETSSKMDDYWSFWGYSTVLVLAIGFFQIVSAHLFLHAQGHKSPVRQGALIAVFIVTASSIFPPIGGNIASYAFQIMASGGRQCSVLRWSASPSEDVTFLIEENGPYSKPLHILLDDNGFYQVRLKDSESDEVHFVPHTSVASMQSCPPATK